MYVNLKDTNVYIIFSGDLDYIIDNYVSEIPDKFNVIDRVSILTIKRRIKRNDTSCIIFQHPIKMTLYKDGIITRYKSVIKDITTEKFYTDGKLREDDYYKLVNGNKKYYTKKPNYLHIEATNHKEWVGDNLLSSITVDKVINNYIYNSVKVDVIELNGTTYYSDKVVYNIIVSEDLEILTLSINYYKQGDKFTRVYDKNGITTAHLNNVLLCVENVDYIPDTGENYLHYIRQL